MGEIAILCHLACIPAAFAWVRLNAVTEVLSPDEPTIHDARLAAKDVVWVDARSEQDYQEVHVMGAISLNEEKWESGLGKLFEAWQPERTIVVYCNARCDASHRVADKLRDPGWNRFSL